MAELTKDDIKGALGFIGEGKRLLALFEKAEEAISTLGHLYAAVESLGAKQKALTADVAALEAKKAGLVGEWEKAKRELIEFRENGMYEISAKASVYSIELMKKAETERDAVLVEIAVLVEKKSELVGNIAKLAQERNVVDDNIALLKKDRVAEQERLDAIRAKIADLKSRL